MRLGRVGATWLAVWLVLIALVGAPAALAQSFPLPPAAATDPVALAKSMPDLAKAVMAVWRDDDRDSYLDTLFRLRIVAGRFPDAAETLVQLRALRAGDTSARAAARNLQYEIFLRAKVIEAAEGVTFDTAFARAFRKAMGRLDDPTSALVARALSQYSPGISLHVPAEENLRDILSRLKGKTDIPLADAVSLLRAWQVEEAYRAMAPLAGALIAEDDHRRYLIENVPVGTLDGATVCALVVRQRSANRRLPTLMEFSIYADPTVNMSEARRNASHGYVGVEGLTRGKGCSPDKPVPQEFDGADAAALIGWISRQAWSDGRVGMFGGSYTGFTQWAALKHHPPALKAIMPAVTAAPGIDTPQEGNVILTFGYYWPFYVTDNKTLDDAAFTDHQRWNNLFRKWYVSGASYRSLEKIDGVPNPFWDRWVDHPGYDAYWQAMIPYRDEFAKIDIPVLTTTGYYDGGQIGALYYLTQHYKYNPKAEHYLIIGPYDHHSGNRGTVDVLGEENDEVRGYQIDPVAHIDLGELRYQWFDYIFKGGAKPTILKDKINYEVMGANEWRHASSLAAMGNQKLRFQLGAAPTGVFHSLSEAPRPRDEAVTQVMNMADRADVDRVSPASGDIVDKVLDTDGSIVFASAPFAAPVELSGLFSGRLEFATNKRDFDFEIQLYELTPEGKYFELSSYLARASYVRDLSRRQLLTSGVRQRLDFSSGRLTSRAFPAESRLLVVVSLIKIQGAQINYGTGKDVSDETIADAGAPLEVRWYGESFIDVPIRR